MDYTGVAIPPPSGHTRCFIAGTEPRAPAQEQPIHLCKPRKVGCYDSRHNNTLQVCWHEVKSRTGRPGPGQQSEGRMTFPGVWHAAKQQSIAGSQQQRLCAACRESQQWPARVHVWPTPLSPAPTTRVPLPAASHDKSGRQLWPLVSGLGIGRRSRWAIMVTQIFQNLTMFVHLSLRCSLDGTTSAPTGAHATLWCRAPSLSMLYMTSEKDCKQWVELGWEMWQRNISVLGPHCQHRQHSAPLSWGPGHSCMDEL